MGMFLYPSGIQPCSGKAGIFTRNAAAKNRTIHSCEPVAAGGRQVGEGEGQRPSGREVTRTPVATAAASMSSEPTSV